MRASERNRRFALIALGLILFDQAFVSLVWYQTIPLQISSDRLLSLPVTLTSAIGVGLVLGLWRLVRKECRLGLTFILAGALSNYLTSARFQQIIDYFPFFSVRNNVADYLVIVGIALAVVAEWRFRPKSVSTS